MNNYNKEELADRIVETRVKRKSVFVLGQAIQTVLAILVLFYEKIVECSNSDTLATSLETQLSAIKNNITKDFTETLSNVGNEFLEEQGKVFNRLTWEMFDTCFQTSLFRDSALLGNISPTDNPAYGVFILFGIISALLAGFVVYCQGCTAQHGIETSISLEDLYLRTSMFPFVDTLLELPIAIRYAPCTTAIAWLALLTMIVLGGITFFAEGSNVILAVLLVILSYLQLVGAICEYRVMTVYKEEDEEDIKEDFPIQEEQRSRSRSRPKKSPIDTSGKEKRSKSRSRPKGVRPVANDKKEEKQSKSRSEREKDRSAPNHDQDNFAMEC